MQPLESDLNKKNQMLLLLKLAQEDNVLDLREETFIIDIALKMGLNRQDIDNLKDNPDKVQVSIPKSEKERMTTLYHLLFLMRIDGKVTREEKDLCVKLGFRLGINPFLVEELISIMDDYDGKIVPQGVMLDAVKKYLNWVEGWKVGRLKVTGCKVLAVIAIEILLLYSPDEQSAYDCIPGKFSY